MKSEPNWVWPNGERIAVVFNVCLEAWSDGKAPGISPMGNPLPAGVLDTMAISWAAYGVEIGIHRLMDAFARHGAPRASVMVNAIIAERARGQGGHGDLQLVAFLPFVEAGGSGLAGSVGIEREDDPLGEPPEEAEVLLGERSAASGHRPRQAGGEEADDVGVALANDHFAGLNDGLFGPVEAVERAPLGVDRRLGRVAVLRAGPLAGTGEDPAAQPDRLAGRVEDREDDPAPEGIPQAVLRPRGRVPP